MVCNLSFFFLLSTPILKCLNPQNEKFQIFAIFFTRLAQTPKLHYKALHPLTHFAQLTIHTLC